MYLKKFFLLPFTSLVKFSCLHFCLTNLIPGCLDSFFAVLLNGPFLLILLIESPFFSPRKYRSTLFTHNSLLSLLPAFSLEIHCSFTWRRLSLNTDQLSWATPFTGWQCRFHDKFLPCYKDSMIEKVQCFTKRSSFFHDNNCNIFPQCLYASRFFFLII